MAGLVLRHAGHPLHAVHGCGHADFYAWMSVTGNNYLFRTAMTNRLSFCCWCFWSHFVFRFRILNLFDISSHKTTVFSEIKPPLPSHFVLQTPQKIYPNTRQLFLRWRKDEGLLEHSAKAAQWNPVIVHFHSTWPQWFEDYGTFLKMLNTVCILNRRAPTCLKIRLSSNTMICRHAVCVFNNVHASLSVYLFL